MNKWISAFVLSGGQIVSRSLLERWSRLTVTERFREPGSLEVVLPAEDAPAVDTVLLFRSRPYTVASIRREPGSRLATVCAPGSLSCFGRRITSLAGRRTGTPEDVILSVGTNAASALPASLRTEVCGPAGTAEAVHVPVGTALGAMTALAAGADRGLQLTFNPDVPEFVLTSPPWSTGESTCRLSEPAETLTDPAVSEDFSEYRNRVYVQGQAVDGVYYPVTVTAESCGFGDGFSDSLMGERWGYLSAPLSPAEYTDEEVFNNVAYGQALRRMGRNYLAAHRPRREISGGIPAAVQDRIRPGDRVRVAVGTDARLCRVAGMTLSLSPERESLSVDLG